MAINNQKYYYEAVGAVHLHSKFSDGSLPIPEIAEIAEKKGLDFLMFSDHNTLKPKRQGFEKWHGSVLVLIGMELNDPDDRNHYLAFRINQELKKPIEAREYVHWVKNQGGFGVIAHPAEKRNYFDAYPPYPWTAWDAKGFNGIEIWNQLSEWIEGVTPINFWWRIMHPLRSIRFPVWEILDRWDQFNQHRRVVGIGGIDVHAYRIKLFGLFPKEIYPYKVQFRSIRTHLLTSQNMKKNKGLLSFREAEKEVYDALSQGRCFVSNHSLGDAKGFRFKAFVENSVYPMGSRLEKGQTVNFYSEAPEPGLIRFLRNGNVVKALKDTKFAYTTKDPGVYRVEVFRKSRGWIYSNPIVITQV